MEFSKSNDLISSGVDSGKAVFYTSAFVTVVIVSNGVDCLFVVHYMSTEFSEREVNESTLQYCFLT